MGAALLGGLIRGGWNPSDIVVVEVDAAKRESLRREHGVGTSDSVVPCDGAIIAVKPGDVAAVCAELSRVGVGRIVSIAAGVTVEKLQNAAGDEVKVVRAMPNTPSLVGEGAAAIVGGTTCTEDDLVWAESLLRSVGVVVRVTESQIDAVTAVAGSGPAYLFLVAEALVSAAVAEGLAPELADALVRQLLKGSGALLAASPEDAETLRLRVTSPNGTTAAGVAVMEDRGIRDLIAATVRRAAERSREMSHE